MGMGSVASISTLQSLQSLQDLLTCCSFCLRTPRYSRKLSCNLQTLASLDSPRCVLCMFVRVCVCVLTYLSEWVRAFLILFLALVANPCMTLPESPWPRTTLVFLQASGGSKLILPLATEIESTLSPSPAFVKTGLFLFLKHAQVCTLLFNYSWAPV